MMKRLAALLPEEFSTVVEIGTNQGAWPRRFIKHIAGIYTIYCIDSWEGEWEAGHEVFRAKLTSELNSGGVVEVWEDSLRAATGWDKPIDVLFIDGDHNAVYPDLRAWVPYVCEGGLVLGHDFSGHYQSPAVQLALFTYFGGTVAWHSGPLVGKDRHQAGRVHSFWFWKEGEVGKQDRRAAKAPDYMTLARQIDGFVTRGKA